MKKTTLVLLLGLSCSAFAQEADDTDRLYDRLEQQDTTALTALTDLAKRQDPYALSVLGFIYEFGVSVPKNTQQAIDYYQQACALGGDYGCYNAGYFYQYGIGVPEDKARASQLLEKINAADIDIETTRTLGHTLYEAKAKAEIDAEMRAPILKYVSRFLNTADDETRRIFSRLGLSKSDTLRLAKRWAQQGDPKVNFYVGHFYNFDYSPIKEKNIEAMRWFRRAAEGGESESQNILGLVYRKGRWGVDAAAQDAVTWFERAAKQGNRDAMINLAEMYYTGEEINVDYGKALALFTEAHEKGASRAARYLAKIYYNGQGVTTNCLKSWEYRSQGGTDETKARYTAHCVNDNRAREENRQILPVLILKDESTFLWGNDPAVKCENHFVVDTDKIGEIANLRVVITLKNTEGVSGKYTLAFEPFGMNTLNESLHGQEYSSFRSAALVAQKTKDFCQRGDVTFQIDSATARINGQEKELLAAGIIKPYVKNAG